jgi:hypothetical protein
MLVIISLVCQLWIGDNSLCKYYLAVSSQERPYNSDSTASRSLCEVKHYLARLVLRWGTTLETRVLFFFGQCFMEAQ